MASMAGNVEFAWASKQLRQFFQSPNAATREDILHVTEEPAQLAPDDLSYEAWLACRKAARRPTGEKGAARSSFKSPGKESKSRRVEQGKNGVDRRPEGRNRCYRVEVGIIFVKVSRETGKQVSSASLRISLPPQVAPCLLLL